MRIRFFVITISFLAIHGTITAQPVKDAKRDNIWIMGKDYWPNTPGIDGCLINFSGGQPDTSYVSKTMEHYITDASICDTAGNLIIYTNGLEVGNRNHLPMSNTEDFYSGHFVEGLGIAACQGALVLPIPESDGLYIVFHPLIVFSEIYTVISKELRYSIIDMSKDNGNGEATLLNEVIVNDTVENGQVVACRHANGRDWWVLVPEFLTNRVYRLLLSPAGVKVDGIQSVGIPLGTRGTLSQAVFSPNGEYYARTRTSFYFVPDTMAIYDFDRCTGLLSNSRIITHTEDSVLAGGAIAIAPNSRFLYKSLGQYVWQYDMQAPDIAASRVLVHTSTHHSFFSMQLGPDGKIYSCAAGGSWFLHRIDYPDLPGVACGVCEDCLALPAQNFGSMPNFPNFRLGPVDGSVCDSLGINAGVAPPAAVLKDLKVWPNPFSETLHVESAGGKAGLLRLYDCLGREVLEAKISKGSGEVKTADLPPGLYFWALWLPGSVHPASGKCVKIAER